MKPTSLLVLGPPKTGKSSFAASLLDLPDVKALKVFTLRPKEADSYGYTTRGINVDVIPDHKWLPNMVPNSKLASESFDTLTRNVIQLYESEVLDGVIIDPLTDVFTAAGRKILAAYGVTTPADVPGKGSMQYFQELAALTRFFVQRLVMLTAAPVPKWVVATMHTRPASEEDINKQKSSDARAKGIRFEGEVLPQMEGSYRYDLGGEFSVQVFTDVSVHYKDGVKYVLQMVPDRERHAAVGVAPLLKVSTIPNSFVDFVKVVEEANK